MFVTVPSVIELTWPTSLTEGRVVLESVS